MASTHSRSCAVSSPATPSYTPCTCSHTCCRHSRTAARVMRRFLSHARASSSARAALRAVTPFDVISGSPGLAATSAHWKTWRLRPLAASSRSSYPRTKSESYQIAPTCQYCSSHWLL